MSDAEQIDLGNAWPLRFNSYGFGARCYNTLASRVLFCNALHTSRSELDGPSGQPHRQDWKDYWNGSFTHQSGPPDSFPTPVEVRWTALDGVQREVEIDLDDVFPDRLILHDAKPEDLEPWWATDGFFGRGHNIDILLEVNDRTISIYMKSRVRTKHLEKGPDGADRHIIHYNMALAWNKTF